MNGSFGGTSWQGSSEAYGRFWCAAPADPAGPAAGSCGPSGCSAGIVAAAPATCCAGNTCIVVGFFLCLQHLLAARCQLVLLVLQDDLQSIQAQPLQELLLHIHGPALQNLFYLPAIYAIRCLSTLYTSIVFMRSPHCASGVCVCELLAAAAGPLQSCSRVKPQKQATRSPKRLPPAWEGSKLDYVLVFLIRLPPDLLQPAPQSPSTIISAFSVRSPSLVAPLAVLQTVLHVHGDVIQHPQTSQSSHSPCEGSIPKPEAFQWPGASGGGKPSVGYSSRSTPPP